MAPSVITIPAPTDNYDHPHSILATVTSLRCLSNSFDATMDSLLESIEKQFRRLESLEGRVHRCRELTARAGEEGKELRVTLPSSYERAISGPAINEVNRGGRTSSSSRASSAHGNGEEEITAVAAARKASDSAIRRALRRDGELDDGLARPSDLWLEAPTPGFDEASACRSALRMHAVPDLRRARLRDELDYYRDVLEGGGKGSMKESGSSGALGGGEGLGDGSSGGSDDIGSVRTGVSLSSHALSVIGGGVTASDRRRQRRVNRELARRRRNHLDGGVIGAPSASDDFASGASSSRQQAASGSLPYLCELLHDAYGVGEAPPTGEDGTVFPEMRFINEAVVFNTDGILAHRPQLSSKSEVTATAMVAKKGEKCGKTVVETRTTVAATVKGGAKAIGSVRDRAKEKWDSTDKSNRSLTEDKVGGANEENGNKDAPPSLGRSGG